LKVPDLPLPE
nr:RecName: Full=Scolopendra 8013.07 Da toxin [Scolopendra angulata]